MSHAMAEKLWKGAPQSPFVPKSYQKQVLKTQEEEKKLRASILHSETNIEHSYELHVNRKKKNSEITLLLNV